MSEGVAFEKWKVGKKFTTRGRTITETDVVNYVNLVGYTESLFLDMEFLREKGHERRMAPALFTCGIADTLIVQTGVLHDYAIALLGVDGLRGARAGLRGRYAHGGSRDDRRARFQEQARSRRRLHSPEGAQPER